MSADNPNSSDPEKDKRVEGKEAEEFFQRLPDNSHWPKPNAEAVAAAVEAIQRMSGGSAAAVDLSASAARGTDESGNACSACGSPLAAGARFCAGCGTPSTAVAGHATVQSQAGAGQHHVHHHYHHFDPSPAIFGHATSSGAPSGEPATSAPRGRAPGAAGSTGGRAEASARQVVLDWAQACNTRHIDDLLELYSADATLIRSSIPPIRSLPAIREFLAAVLEAGLGDVEMESLRIEVMGEIALDLGRCKMLVPVAMGKRREERGKYLVVLVRQPAGNWKILVDCWSADLAVGAAQPDAAARKGNDTAPPQRKPR